MNKNKSEVHLVTSLPESPDVERARRFKTYAFAMLVRLISIPLVFVVPFPFNILPILLAVFIPAWAVVLANSVSVPVVEKPTPITRSINSGNVLD